MTMTRACRRVTPQMLQIRLTLGLTFTVCLNSQSDGFSKPPRPALLVAVDNPPTGQVVRRELDDDPVLGKDADVVLPHLAGDVSQYLVTVSKLHAEHGVRQGLDHSAFDFDGSVFLWHVLRYLTSGLGLALVQRLTRSSDEAPSIRGPPRPPSPAALEAVRTYKSGRGAPASQCTRAPAPTPNRGHRYPWSGVSSPGEPDKSSF